MIGKWVLCLIVGIASVMAGAQGVLLECHPDPSKALSDAPQALSFEQLEKLVPQLHQCFELAHKMEEEK